MADADDDAADLSEEEKAMEMQVICSGILTDDVSTVLVTATSQTDPW
jgi:transcription initiation factor TFIID subunit 2